MSNAAGVIIDMQIDKETIVLPSDLELTFWSGGKMVTESYMNNDGSRTRKTEIVGGIIKGINARLTRNNAIKNFAEKIKKAAEEDLDFIFTLACGDKYTAPVFIQTTEDFWTNMNGQGTFKIVAANGTFNLVG